MNLKCAATVENADATECLSNRRYVQRSVPTKPTPSSTVRAPITISQNKLGGLDDFILSEIDHSSKGVKLTYRLKEYKNATIVLEPYAVVKMFETAIPAPQQTVVRQGKFECAAAALAQALGEELFWVKRAMGKHHWRNDDRGASHEVMQLAAQEFGKDLIVGGRKMISALEEDFPTCCVSVPSVNVSGMGHAVSWVNGEILDPNFGDPNRKFWGPNWAPWTMNATSIDVVAKRVLSLAEHRELKELRNRASKEEIKEVIWELAA